MPLSFKKWNFGGVAEWLSWRASLIGKAPDLKSGVPLCGIGGSNPSPSVKKIYMKKLEIAKQELEQLYWHKGLTMKGIASLKGIHLQTIYRKMKKFNIPKRSFKSKTVIYKINNNFSNEDKLLLLTALILYWCEGANDSNGYTLGFTNSDPLMLKIWINFLKEILLVPSEKIKVKVHIHKNQDGNAENIYWKAKLNLDREIIQRPYVTKKNSTRSDYHGTVNIRVHSKFYYNTTMYWIKELVDIILGE